MHSEPPYGKGKGRHHSFESSPAPKISIDPPLGDSTCGICQEDFTQCNYPIEAALQSSDYQDAPNYGVELRCLSRHQYCLECFNGYIRTKLANDASSASPIRCPECRWEIDDRTASRALGKDLLEVWHHNRLLQNLQTVRKSICRLPRLGLTLDISVLLPKSDVLYDGGSPGKSRSYRGRVPCLPSSNMFPM